MIYHLSSSDPSNYGLVTFKNSFTQFMQSKRIKYRIASMSSIANIAVTTSDDFIIINDIKIQFNEHGAYEPYLFETELKSILNPFMVSIDSLGRVVISSSEGSVRITEASHRVKMLLGLYHTELPIEGLRITCPSAPYLCYGNVLYLLARHGAPVAFGTKNKEEYHCIVYKSFEFLHRGLPIICRHEGVTIRTTADSFQALQFTLVDMMLEPIILLAPLYITIESSSDDTHLDSMSVQ